MDVAIDVPRRASGETKQISVGVPPARRISFASAAFPAFVAPIAAEARALHDEKLMGRSGDENEGGRHSKADLSALEEAFADVKPLDGKSPRRVTRPPDPSASRIAAGRSSARGAEVSLRVERESNGIIVGRRQAVHRSILDSLEDPRLEVEARIDLHGFKAREAEREAQRFVRECQQNGKRWVLIIVGKGLHSRGGKATLKGQIVDALSQRAASRYVLAFRTAPRHLGGTGAIVVRLVDRV